MAPIPIGRSHPSSDHTLCLPDDCLVLIFHSLQSHTGDRRRSSLVCRRWLRIEALTRLRLTFDLSLAPRPIPSLIFARFPSVTHLSLTGPASADEALLLISFLFPFRIRHLACLTLSACILSADGLNALSHTSASLEELHLRTVRFKIQQTGVAPRAASSSSSLKLVCLDDIYDFDAQLFAPLIRASKSLTTLRLASIPGSTVDALLHSLSATVTEIHMESVVLSIAGWTSISRRCPNLETLRLEKIFRGCSNAGMAMVAKGCSSLRRLHINHRWSSLGRNEEIGEKGLVAVAENCPNLEELVLANVNVSVLSLEMLGAYCVKLELLSFLGGYYSFTLRNEEINCIATKFSALKTLLIEDCPWVTVLGIQALASGCPRLVEVRFIGCWKVSLKVARQLKSRRASLLVGFAKFEKDRDKRLAYHYIR